jgi:hypothetical protein
MMLHATWVQIWFNWIQICELNRIKILLKRNVMQTCVEHIENLLVIMVLQNNNFGYKWI